MNKKKVSIALLFIFGFNQFIFCPKGKKLQDQNLPKRPIGSDSDDLKKSVDENPQKSVVGAEIDKAKVGRITAANRAARVKKEFTTMETEKALIEKRIKEIDDQKKIMTQSFIRDPELNKFSPIIFDYYKSANPGFKQDYFASFFDGTPEGLKAQEKINQAKRPDEILKATEERMKTRAEMQSQLDEFIETLKAQPEGGENVEKYVLGVLSEIANRNRPITPLTASDQAAKEEQDFLLASQRRETKNVFGQTDRLNASLLLERTISSEKEKLNKRAEEQEVQKTSLNEEIKAIDSKIIKLETKIKSLNKNLSKLVNEITYKESVESVLKNRKPADQNAIDVVRTELLGLAGKRNSIELQLEKANENLINNKNSLRDKNKELKALEVSLKSIKSKIEDKKTQEKELKKRQDPGRYDSLLQSSIL